MKHLTAFVTIQEGNGFHTEIECIIVKAVFYSGSIQNILKQAHVLEMSSQGSEHTKRNKYIWAIRPALKSKKLSYV